MYKEMLQVMLAVLLAVVLAMHGTATKLQTARKINGTNFDGSGDITTSKWGTARTLALNGAISGSASVDGSGNVSIQTAQANITVLSGNITVAAESTGDVTLSYPTGYSYANCIPISCGIKENDNRGYNFVGDHNDIIDLTFVALHRRLNLNSSNITFSIVNPATSTHTYTYKIVLMKIS